MSFTYFWQDDNNNVIKYSNNSSNNITSVSQGNFFTITFQAANLGRFRDETFMNFFSLFEWLLSYELIKLWTYQVMNFSSYEPIKSSDTVYTLKIRLKSYLFILHCFHLQLLLYCIQDKYQMLFKKKGFHFTCRLLSCSSRLEFRAFEMLVAINNKIYVKNTISKV